jgi:hypothetical protein
MQVGVDHWPKRPGAFDPGIKVEPELARERKIRSLPGRDYDPVHRTERTWAVWSVAFKHGLITNLAHSG